jgi:hypothetical protein
MTALVRATQSSGYAATSPTVVFGTAAQAGDIVILCCVYSSTGNAPALTGLPTGMGATWTLLGDSVGGRVAFWIGRGVTAGQTTVTCGVGRTGANNRFVGWLVGGVNNPASAVVDFAAIAAPTLSGQGPSRVARNGQFVAAAASFGNALTLTGSSPPASDGAGHTWVRYDPSTSGTTEFASATPGTARELAHQVTLTSTLNSSTYGIVTGQVVIGDYTGPGTARAHGQHGQALYAPPPSVATMRAAQVQVLMPTEQPASLAYAQHAQVMLDAGWVVSASDGVTPVQVLHSDGVWRPIYLA